MITPILARQEGWNRQQQIASGFKFSGYDPHALLAELDRALAAFQDKESWQKLMRNGMAREYGWAKPASEYSLVYQEAARRRA